MNDYTFENITIDATKKVATNYGDIFQISDAFRISLISTPKLSSLEPPNANVRSNTSLTYVFSYLFRWMGSLRFGSVKNSVFTHILQLTGITFPDY